MFYTQRILIITTVPRDLKNDASFLNVCDAGRQNFVANEETDCRDTDTTTVFIAVSCPA